MLLLKYYTTHAKIFSNIFLLGGISPMDADPTGNSIVASLLLLIFFTLMNAFFAGLNLQSKCNK